MGKFEKIYVTDHTHETKRTSIADKYATMYRKMKEDIARSEKILQEIKKIEQKEMKFRRANSIDGEFIREEETREVRYDAWEKYYNCVMRLAEQKLTTGVLPSDEIDREIQIFNAMGLPITMHRMLEDIRKATIKLLYQRIYPEHQEEAKHR